MTESNQTSMRNRFDPHRAHVEIDRLFSLWPIVLGIALGRVGLLVGYSTENSVRVDFGLFTDAVSFATVSSMIVTGVTASLIRWKNDDRRAARFTVVLIVVHAAVLLLLAPSRMADASLGVAAVLFAIMMSSIYLIWLFWYERLSSSDPRSIAIVILSALALSDILFCALMLIDGPLVKILSAALSLLQLPCLAKAVSAEKRSSSLRQPPKREGGSPQDNETRDDFLAFCLYAVCLLGMIKGTLEKFPFGAYVPTPSQWWLFTALLSIVVCAALLLLNFRLSTYRAIFAFLLGIAGLFCIDLVLFAAFPDAPEVGAFVSHLIGSPIQGLLGLFICLMPASRDNVSFAQRGMLVFAIYLASRLLTRYAVSLTGLFSHNMTLAFVLVGIALMALVAAMLVQAMKLLGAIKQEMMRKDRQALDELLEKENAENLSQMRRATIFYNASELGKQYLLSEREVEVIALYALGYTQKRIADELHVSPNTVHSHIQGVYAKTELHSRQAILDYMQYHTS